MPNSQQSRCCLSCKGGVVVEGHEDSATAAKGVSVFLAGNAVPAQRAVDNRHATGAFVGNSVSEREAIWSGSGTVNMDRIVRDGAVHDDEYTAIADTGTEAIANTTPINEVVPLFLTVLLVISKLPRL